MSGIPVIRKILGLPATGIALGFILNSCANMSASLSGGARDTIPPKLVSSIPVMNAKNFNGRKIEINFDEFLKTTDIAKQLVISPPLKHNPIVEQRNKTVYISIDDADTLKPNTTYTLYFDDAIRDLDEENILKDFHFVFSTGTVIDSLSLRGLVVNSFDHLPDKSGYDVMLYKNLNDSAPHKLLPDYITRTDAHGYFNLVHIPQGTYRIFALKDANQNLMYDQPTEAVAFADSVLHLDNRYFVPEDSVLKDTTNYDSLRMVVPFLMPQIELYTFTKDYKKQYLEDSKRPKPYQFVLQFNRVPYDSVTITPLNFDAKSWYLRDRNIASDTMTYWITDTALIRKDTLHTIISFFKKDSLGTMILTRDTISLIKKIRIAAHQRKKEVTQKRINEFTVTSSANNRTDYDLNKKVVLSSSFPLKDITVSKLHLYSLRDDKSKEKIPIKFNLTRDSIYIRNYDLNFHMESNTEYVFTADSAAFTSIYAQTTDSTGFKFKTQRDDYYGNLKLNLSHVTGHLIVQLLDLQEKVVSEKYTDTNGPVIFKYLAPGKYKLKVIYDQNNNHTWDTGNFDKNIEPERVAYYYEFITVRSNWDIDQSWKLE